MELTGVGSGVMFAVAALLWLVYLVPTWLRRREFDATERNAVRLQQTLRVLAETSDVPAPVRAEANARSIAEQAKVARAQERARAARERARAAEARAMATAAVRGGVAKTPAPSGMRLRRARALTSLLLLASIVTLVVSAGAAVASGPTMATWLLVFAGLIGSTGCFAMLRRLAPGPRPVTAAPAAPLVRKQTSGPAGVGAEAGRPQREWTPVPVPKPLYLSRQAVMQSAPRVDLASEAARAERALRASHASAAQVAPRPQQPPSAEPAVGAASAPTPTLGSASRFAAMGHLDPSALAPADIEAALRRRRAAS